LQTIFEKSRIGHNKKTIHNNRIENIPLKVGPQLGALYAARSAQAVNASAI
jgi:hypothetical protein